jgi:large subunit ribosomal protein L14e
MIDIGRLCVKIAGRDAGMKCAVVDIINDKFVMIDGQTRRKRCNISHLEPLKEKIDLKKGASHSEVVSAFKKLKIEIKEKKGKKQKAARPKTKRHIKHEERKAKKAEAAKEAKAAKKPAKKAEKK